MFNFFKTKCEHPAKHLFVDCDATVEAVDDLFDKVTYHLYCEKCEELIDISYAKPTDKFFEYGLKMHQ